MIKITLTFLIISVVYASGLALSECKYATIPNNCDLYHDCIESMTECGDEGYALGYGKKYCNKFNRLELSNEGEKWITKTMSCLQGELVDFTYAPNDCTQIKNKAMNSHVTCYVSSGFCALPLSDINKIITTNMWGIFTSFDAQKQSFKVLEACLKIFFIEDKS